MIARGLEAYSNLLGKDSSVQCIGTIGNLYLGAVYMISLCRDATKRGIVLMY